MSIVKSSTVQLLRFHFSYFLMPVFWFALSFSEQIQITNTVLAFVLLHFLLYPSSNGYNSYMDRDVSSIGGIEKPLLPEKQLFTATVILDALGIILAFFISMLFAVLYVTYIVFSRLYSYRGVRLKQYAVTGYITVVINQGALIFFMVHYASAGPVFQNIMPWEGPLAATFLIGGFYPITQIYQHKEDAADGVKTISMKLGKKGTFIFCTIMYMLAFGILFIYFQRAGKVQNFVIIQIFFLPVILFFVKWMLGVWKNESLANYKNTMKMNWLAATCTNLAFITLLILNQIG